MLRVCALALIILAPLPLPVWADDDQVIDFSDNDPIMNKAIASAKSTLPLFMAHVLAPDGMSQDDAYVKVAMPTAADGREGEAIWVGPFIRLDAVNIAGLLANEPDSLGHLRLGDRIDFTYDMIVDWSFLGADGLRYGDYTTPVMVAYLPKDEADSVLAGRSADPVPADWR